MVMKFNEFTDADWEMFAGAEVANAADGTPIEPMVSDELPYVVGTVKGTAFIVVDANGLSVFVGDEVRGMDEYRTKYGCELVQPLFLANVMAAGEVFPEVLAAFGFEAAGS